MKETKLDINVNPNVVNQLKVIFENDFTLEGKVFRLQIDGKGCGGFDYALGFTEPHPDDIILDLDASDPRLVLHLDPFCAFYCAQGTLDYINDPLNDQEGFAFTNANEKSYRGKFFKDETKVPQFK